jgi:hypothetical protein
MAKWSHREIKRNSICSITLNAKPCHLPMGQRITAKIWPFAIQHAATIFNTTKRRSRDYEESPWGQFTGEQSKLDQHDVHPLFFQYTF